MKKVLFFSYYFPPTGGAGVQRAVKFVKYLPQFGYQCAVLAGGDKSFNYNLKQDDSLADSINAKIFRITLNEKEEKLSKLYPPILKRYLPAIALNWWKTSAKRSMQQAVDNFKPDIIFVTVSPFAAAEVTMQIASKNKIPWVLDMRDPWALDPINFYPSKLHYKIDYKKMKKVCCRADAIIMNTPNALKALKEEFAELDTKKCFCITNGWDKEDFKNFYPTQSHDSTSSLKIVHTGLFHTNYAQKVDPKSRKILTGKGKNPMDYLRYNSGKTHLLARTPYYLFKAAKKLIDSGKIKKNDLLFTFAGVASDADKKLGEIFNLSEIVKWTGYLGHNKSIELLNTADVLFLPLHTCRNMHPLIVPGKTYEYMVAKKPILALVPDGDCKDFIMESGLGFTAQPDNVKKIAETLLYLITQKKQQNLSVKPNHNSINHFERERLTSKLADVLELF